MPQTLSARLNQPGLIVAPGVYDLVSAKLADQAGFDALYMTGFGVVASYLGYPDAGLATYSDMAGRVRQIPDTAVFSTSIIRCAATKRAALKQSNSRIKNFRKNADTRRAAASFRWKMRQERSKWPPRRAHRATSRLLRGPMRAPLTAWTRRCGEAKLFLRLAPTSCSSNRPKVLRRWSGSDRRFKCLCWPTWSRAAARQLSVGQIWKSLDTRSRFIRLPDYSPPRARCNRFIGI